MALENGTKLGPYEILSPAGAGGMGEVYRAKDTRLDRIVAIKVLPSLVAGNAEIRQRFDREAKAISSLNHPNICTLHDVGHQDGIDFLVMEYLDGETLSVRLTKGPLATAELLTVATQIADALDKAHRQGLVHRDLKPGNIMLTKGGAKLMDFGLAKLQQVGGIFQGASGITRTTPLTGEGAIVGTLQYMSPEQLEGKEADVRSDIFAFGTILYEMATGQRAFVGGSQASLIASILKEQPRSISEFQPLAPPVLERIVKQCLEKDPDHRWQAAGDLKRALQWIAEGGSQIGVPLPIAARRKVRDRALWGSTILFALATGLLGTLYLRQAMKPKEVLRMNILAPEGTNYDMLYGGQFALSPDGSMLAFVATDTTRGAVSKLWVRKLSSLEALPLPGTDKAYWPFWSPDSKYIAFFAEQKLKKILASGAPPLSICDSIRTARGGSWGRKDIILFTPNWEGPLYKVSAAGGIATVASRLDSTYKDFTHRWVDFLPDGEHFIFYSRTEGNVGGERDAICVGSLNSPEIKRLFAAKSSASYDDGHILFVRDGVLMAQPFDPNSLDLNGDAVPTAERVTSIKAFSRSAFSVAPSGRIVYQNWETQSGSKLLIIDREGRVLDSIGEIADQFHLRLSPDEKYLAIQMNDPNANNTDIWIVDLVRRIQSRFTFDAGYDLAPVWSPDGSQIAYYSQYNKHMGIYIKATTSADTGRLVFESDLSLWIECWSNDGKYLVFQQSTNTDADDIWILPLEIDSKPFKFLATKYQENDAQISPDGRWMAYFSDESGKGQVYVSPFPKPTAKWQVSVREGSRPMWSKDGKQVYYIDNEDHVMVAQVDGAGSMFQVGKVERLFEVRQFRPVNDYDVFSDNKRFVVNTPMSDKTNSTLIFVQNWAEELKK